MSPLLFILSLSPLLVYLIHALLIRLARGKPYQLTVIFSILIGNVPIVIICLIYILKAQMTLTETIATVSYCLIVYNALAYVYFHIFNMSETARRVHILIALKRAGRMEKQNILEQYTSKDIVDIRLSRLLSLKQLKIEGSTYKINRSFLLIAAKIYSVWAWLLGFQEEAQRGFLPQRYRGTEATE